MVRKQKAKPEQKPDKAHVAQVAKWILTGASAQDVAEAIARHYPGADAPSLIFAAMETFREAANFEPTLVRGWAFEATRAVYAKALESNDHAAALRAIKTLLEITRHVRNQPGNRDEDEEEEADADGE